MNIDLTREQWNLVQHALCAEVVALRRLPLDFMDVSVLLSVRERILLNNAIRFEIWLNTDENGLFL